MNLKTGILCLILAAGLAAQTAAGNFAGSGSSAAGYLGPAVGNWSIIQHQMFSTSGSTGSGSCASGTSTCTVNVSAIGAGHLLVCLPHGVSVSGVNACSGDAGTWAECCLITNGTLTADIWWVLSSAGGGTSITCNFASTSTYKECGFREYALSAGSPVFDNGSSGIRGGCVTGSCQGFAVGITGSNDVIVQSVFASVGVTGSSYGNLDVSSASPGGGSADLLNTNNGSAPSWVVTGTNNIAANGAAFTTSLGLLATRPPARAGPAPRRPARRAARRRRRRRNERQEKRDDRDERRDDRRD